MAQGPADKTVPVFTRTRPHPGVVAVLLDDPDAADLVLDHQTVEIAGEEDVAPPPQNQVRPIAGRVERRVQIVAAGDRGEVICHSGHGKGIVRRQIDVAFNRHLQIPSTGAGRLLRRPDAASATLRLPHGAPGLRGRR